MDEEKTNIEEVANIKNTEDLESEKKNRKEKFDTILDKIKKMDEAVELHINVKDAVAKEEVDSNYLKYIENSLENKLFNNTKFDKIKSKVLLDVICPELVNVKDFDENKLEIEDVGNHYEELDNYIDKICIYDGKLVCLFGIKQSDSEKAIKYEPRKFSRKDMIEAVCQKLEEGQKVEMEQYDEYYVVNDGNSLKVFTERKVLSLVKVEETIYDKIKNKLQMLFHSSKRKYMPDMKMVYDSNPNRIKGFKVQNKQIAKARMKDLLTNERKLTRTEE